MRSRNLFRRSTEASLAYRHGRGGHGGCCRVITGGVAVPQTAGRHRRPPRVGEDEGGLDQVVVRLDGVAGRLLREKPSLSERSLGNIQT